MNFEKELDRLTSLKIIEKRFSFLFEDVWFILIQYFYFEKFVSDNVNYVTRKAGRDPYNGMRFENGCIVICPTFLFFYGAFFSEYWPDF